MEIKKFQRKSFDVEGVQVTEENFQEVVQWCSGHETFTSSGQHFIRVDVLNPLSERQTKAFVGDWVLKSPRKFKVYTKDAFGKSFTEVGFEATTINVFNENLDAYKEEMAHVNWVKKQEIQSQYRLFGHPIGVTTARPHES